MVAYVWRACAPARCPTPECPGPLPSPAPECVCVFVCMCACVPARFPATCARAGHVEAAAHMRTQMRMPMHMLMHRLRSCFGSISSSGTYQAAAHGTASRAAHGQGAGTTYQANQRRGWGRRQASASQDAGGCYNWCQDAGGCYSCPDGGFWSHEEPGGCYSCHAKPAGRCLLCWSGGAVSVHRVRLQRLMH